MNAAQLSTAANVAEIQALQGCKVSAAYLHLYAMHKAEDSTIRYARELTEMLQKKHYPEIIGFEPLDDMTGLISQIDNITSSLTRKDPPQNPTPPEEPPFVPCYPIEAGPFDANDDGTSLLAVAKQRLEEDGTGWI